MDQTVSLLEVLVLWEIVPVLLVLLSLILAGVVSHTVPFEVLSVSAVLLLVWNVDLQVFVGEVPLWLVFLLLLSVKVVKLMLFGVVFPAVFVLLSLLCGEFVDLEVFRVISPVGIVPFVMLLVWVLMVGVDVLCVF